MTGQAARSDLKIHILIAVFAIAAMVLLFVPERHLPPLSDESYWNAAVAFLVTTFLCEAWALRTLANTNTSVAFLPFFAATMLFDHPLPDRKSTRLNSSHPSISYAVFCLKKKKQTKKT